MAINPQAFAETQNGRQQTTDGLWVHRGLLWLTDSAGGVLQAGNGDGTLHNRHLVTGYVAPRISNTGWSDAHVRLDQGAPSEPRIGFHESGSSALALYKPSGSHSQLRVRGNDGADYAVAGAAGSGQALLGQYVGPLSWSTPAAGAWYESPVQVNATCSGALLRLEGNANVGCNTAGAVCDVGLGIDGGVIWSLARWNTNFAGQVVPISVRMYYTPAAGAHRFSVFINVMTGLANIDGVATTTLFVTEQRI